MPLLYDGVHLPFIPPATHRRLLPSTLGLGGGQAAAGAAGGGQAAAGAAGGGGATPFSQRRGGVAGVPGAGLGGAYSLAD